MLAPAVSLRGITRRFGPVLANDDVSLDLAPGEIHALVGENGAGKTTLMRVLYGMIAPDSGAIEVEGRAVRIHHPADAMRLGLGMVHQHFMLVDTLTVAENVCLGREPGRFGMLDRARAEREVMDRSSRHGLPVDPRARVAALSVGEQQRVEILKALYHGARVLILDEPTAVLTPQEVDDLFRVLRELKRGGARRPRGSAARAAARSASPASGVPGAPPPSTPAGGSPTSPAIACAADSFRRSRLRRISCSAASASPRWAWGSCCRRARWRRGRRACSRS